MDTIVLRIENYRINLDYDRSIWNLRKFASTKNNFIKIESLDALAKYEFALIPKESASRVRYYPQITQKLNKYGKFDVEIQCSIPKLLFRTNLFEVDFANPDFESDIYDALFDLTRPLLYPEPTIDAVKQAEIRRIDLAKNIILEGKDIVNDFLQEVTRFCLSSSLDVREIQYKPNDIDGRAVNFWNTSQAYCFYNKKLEILSIDSKKANPEVLYLQSLLRKYPIEILRLERRLQTSQATRIFLERYIESSPITLQALLEHNYNIGRLLIKDMVRDFRINNLNLFTSQPINDEKLSFIKQSLEKNSFSKTARNYLMRDILKELGIQKGWEYIKGVSSVRSTRNYRHDLDQSDFKLYSASVNDVFEHIEEQVETFSPLSKSRLLRLCKEDGEEFE